MSALSSTNKIRFGQTTTISHGLAQRIRLLVETGAVIQPNGLVGVHDGSGAGTKGEIVPYANTKGVRLLGFHLGDSAVTGDGSTYASVFIGRFVLRNVTVAGVTAGTNFGAPVFCTTDNVLADLTLTKPSENAEPVGAFHAWNNSTYGDVEIIPARILTPSTTGAAEQYTADGAIALPAVGVDVTEVHLSGSAATAQMTLAAPGSTARVGQKVLIIADDVSNAVDVDYTDAVGSKTFTFHKAGEMLLLMAVSATVWARLSVDEVVVPTTLVADGAITLPPVGRAVTRQHLSGASASCATTLAAPGASRVGQRLILIADSVANTVDVDYTDSGGAVTHTFTEAGESIELIATTAGVWSRNANQKDDT